MENFSDKDFSREWSLVLEDISQHINPNYFHNFITPLKLIKINDAKVILLAPSSQIQKHVETKYISFLEQSIFRIFKERFQVEIITDNSNNLEIWSEHIKDKVFQTKAQFNPDYTFDTFIQDETNKLAYTACREAVLRPGEINPLYIFGSVGVGKTHLLHAIGNEILKREPWKKVRYVEMTTFLNEFVFTVRQNSRTALDSFKIKYQSYDVLLIDDIQFLNSGADKTQEEFFSLFNYLYQKRNQIVIASDRPSFELPIHERLKSRFTKGIQANIQPPSIHLKKNILKRFSDIHGIFIDEVSLDYIANNIPGDIRYLIGAMNDVLLYKKAYHCVIVPFDAIKEIVDTRRETRKKTTGLDQEIIIDRVCQAYNQSRKDVLGKSRKIEYVIPRHVIMYILHTILHLNKTVIGRIFDCKHTTVLHAIENIKIKLESDSKIKEIIENIRSDFDLL